MDTSTQIVIGICGISQSGKSTLTQTLKKELQARGKTVKIFEIDHYTVEENQIPTVRDRIDWEHPDSIDWPRLLLQVKKATAEVVIIEGIFAFHSSLLPFYSRTVLIELDRETFLERRKREIRWGQEPLWYLDHVWETNQELVKIHQADLKLSHIDVGNFERVLNLIGVNHSVKI